LLGAYLYQRILFFLNRDETRQTQIDQSTSQLQASLWASIRGSASAQPTPVTALVLAGMNDVINFARLHTSDVLESDSRRRVVAHGGHRTVLQRAVRI
jgi:hypothetical protein